MRDIRPRTVVVHRNFRRRWLAHYRAFNSLESLADGVPAFLVPKVMGAEIAGSQHERQHMHTRYWVTETP